jgi:PAS domain S-box-containing protein
MNRKISLMALFNIIIVVLIMTLHEFIESFSNVYMIVILFIYALLNGLYIERELKKQKILEESLGKEKDLTEIILKTIPTGIVVIDTDGIITYVNESIGKILGSVETVGKNILKFDTVENAGLDKKISDAIEGNGSHMKDFKYVSYTSRETKYINITLKPFNLNLYNGKYNVMMFIDDVTHEINLQKKSENQYLGMFKSFVRFIDAKDAYTGSHSVNVSKYVNNYFSKFGENISEIHDINIAAALHDIGKIGIRDAVLNKPGKLTKEEFEIIKKHPSIGADIIGEIEAYKNISNIIRYHHERWDGKGYPEGLKGNEIPFVSQIIAIADTYDALISDRIYKKAISKEQAIIILRQEKWKQFNGDYVENFIKMIEEGL